LFSNEGELDRLKVSEAGRLQTFPADYPWSGKDVSQQIGNAIPPRLAAHVLAAALGRELAPGFFDTMTRTPWLAIDSETIKAAPHTEHAHGCSALREEADFDPPLDLIPEAREERGVDEGRNERLLEPLAAKTSGVLSM
jgi:DNA (cytosine-5)-methyltransferase 1